jgi:hypothetical protein
MEILKRSVQYTADSGDPHHRRATSNCRSRSEDQSRGNGTDYAKRRKIVGLYVGLFQNRAKIIEILQLLAGIAWVLSWAPLLPKPAISNALSDGSIAGLTRHRLLDEIHRRQRDHRRCDDDISHPIEMPASKPRKHSDGDGLGNTGKVLGVATPAVAGIPHFFWAFRSDYSEGVTPSDRSHLRRSCCFRALRRDAIVSQRESVV